jgi:RNA polymerase sigma-70 factor (ECF subfamily)
MDGGYFTSRYVVDVTTVDANDDAMLVAAARRDRKAYARIVTRHAAPLRRYIRRVLGADAQSAEDVLQETFIKAYVNLNDYDDRRSFAPWIYRIAHNEAVNHLRRNSDRSRTIDGEDGAMLLAHVADGVDWPERIAAGDALRLVRTALSGLTPRYRDVLVLRYLEEKSYDEISDILQLPPGTVATQIDRGVKKLRAILEASGVGRLGSFLA